MSAGPIAATTGDLMRAILRGIGNADEMTDESLAEFADDVAGLLTRLSVLSETIDRVLAAVPKSAVNGRRYIPRGGHAEFRAALDQLEAIVWGIRGEDDVC